MEIIDNFYIVTVFVIVNLRVSNQGKNVYKGWRKRGQYFANIWPTLWPTMLDLFALQSPTFCQHFANILLSPSYTTSNNGKWGQDNNLTSKKQWWANVGELLANNIKSVWLLANNRQHLPNIFAKANGSNIFGQHCWSNVGKMLGPFALALNIKLCDSSMLHNP